MHKNNVEPVPLFSNTLFLLLNSSPPHLHCPQALILSGKIKVPMSTTKDDGDLWTVRAENIKITNATFANSTDTSSMIVLIINVQDAIHVVATSH
jgi:hypothetical protein